MLPNYPVISSNLVLGNGVFGTCDPYVSTAENNGALNPLGSVYYLGPGEGGLQSNQFLTAATSKGCGSGLWVKYVRYTQQASDTSAVQAGPAPVFWVDETYTQVTDLSTSSATGTLNSVAGWLLPNTTALGSTAFTITVLNGGGNGTYVFIGLQGWIGGCFIGASCTKGYGLIGSSTAWTPTQLASATTAPTSKLLGYCLQTVSNTTTTLCDVEANLPLI
jgi:hypothetical protein